MRHIITWWFFCQKKTSCVSLTCTTKFDYSKWQVLLVGERIALCMEIVTSQNELCGVEWSEGCLIEQNDSDLTRLRSAFWVWLARADSSRPHFISTLHISESIRKLCKRFIVFFDGAFFILFLFSTYTLSFHKLRRYFQFTPEQFQQVLLQCTIILSQ